MGRRQYFGIDIDRCAEQKGRNSQEKGKKKPRRRNKKAAPTATNKAVYHIPKGMCIMEAAIMPQIKNVQTNRRGRLSIPMAGIL